MSFDHIFEIILFFIGLGLSIWWIIPIGFQAWFHPDEFEKIIKEPAARHWLSVNNPKYNWKVIMVIYRIFTVVFALVLLVIMIEILAGLIGLIL